MALPEIQLLDSLEQLLAQQETWNDLWARVPAASPLARAEQVALWARQFAGEARFRAVVVAVDGRPMAALPLVGRGLAGRIGWGALPVNEWSSGGTLLVDPTADHLIFERLTTGLRLSGWSLWSLNEVDLVQPAWTHWLAALAGQGCPCEFREQFVSSRVAVHGAWSDYLASRTKKHRHNLRRNLGRLCQAGPTEFRFFDKASPGEVPALLARGFGVEDRSWKGNIGSSVRQVAGMLEFHTAQASALAAAGQLRLGFLEHQGEAIAFDYGFAAQGVYFRSKIGYDQRFAAFSPGQLLAAALLERLHDVAEVQAVDFMGPLSDALAKWATETYSLGRLLIAAPGVVGRTLFEAYRAAHRWKARRADNGAPPARAEGETAPAAAQPELVEV